MNTFAPDTPAEFFQPFVGQPFIAQVAQQEVSLRLAKISPAPSVSEPTQGFALIFEGPLQPQLVEGTYVLQHPQLGDNEVLIVPVGQGHSGTRYEVTFG